jgi:hypothetical protein
MQLIKPESKIHYMSSLKIPSNDQLIIVEEIKMNLLAKSCFAPGLIALLSNLTSSAGTMSDAELDKKDWLKDYTMGMGYEIYRASMHPNFEGLTFKDVVRIIYKEYKAIVFALGIESQGKSIVVLNPIKYKLLDFNNTKYYMFMICEDASVADQAELLNGISRENKKKYFGFIDLKKNTVDIELSITEKRETDDMLGSFIQFDAEDDIEIDLTEQDLSQDYFMLNKAQSQMDVTVTTTLKNHRKIKNHIVVCGIH